jgi:hypothetical protein
MIGAIITKQRTTSCHIVFSLCNSGYCQMKAIIQWSFLFYYFLLQLVRSSFLLSFFNNCSTKLDVNCVHNIAQSAIEKKKLDDNLKRKDSTVTDCSIRGTEKITKFLTENQGFHLIYLVKKKIKSSVRFMMGETKKKSLQIG